MENVKSNFKDFGFYKTVLDAGDIYSLDNAGIGDAIDDLNDIIFDLLEVKWRIENNSLNDGLFYFDLLFRAHTKDHILGLLSYLDYKEFSS